jgi:alpha-N-arabinofuranosidase
MLGWIKLCFVFALFAGPGMLTAASPIVTPVAQARFDWFDYRGSNPANARLRRSSDTYLNPILSGFYPDPNILRVGSDYYLVNSSFGYFPGLPIFHSRDLVNWTQIGNALSRPEQFPMQRGEVSNGAYAPALAYHDSLFYLINKCFSCRGNYWMTAKNPAGPWSNPNWMTSITGFDPSLFFDGDGKAYVVYAQRATKPAYNGHTGIWIQQWDMAGNKSAGEPVLLLDKGIGKDPYYAEGPHIYRRGDYYYLILAQGGTGANHAQVVLRSRALKGPYEAYPGNPILTQVGTAAGADSHPITSTGHVAFVATPAGDWWAVFLATQPYGDDLYNTGRETFMLPVKWTADGWPTILPHGQPVPRLVTRPRLPAQRRPAIPTSGDFHVRDEYDRAALPPYWMMLRAPERQWWSIDQGSLLLEARAEPLGGGGQPSYLARRQQHMNASFTTRVHFSPRGDEDRAGLALFQSEAYFFFFGIGRQDGRPVIKLERRSGRAVPAAGELLASAALTGSGPVDLRITAEGGRYGFAYAVGGRWRTLAGNVDGSILSTKTSGGFVGVTAGPYAYSAANQTVNRQAILTLRKASAGSSRTGVRSGLGRRPAS